MSFFLIILKGIFSLSLPLSLEFASHFFNQPLPSPPQRVKKRKIVPEKIKLNINSRVYRIPGRHGLEIIIFPTSIKFILAFINKHVESKSWPRPPRKERLKADENIRVAPNSPPPPSCVKFFKTRTSDVSRIFPRSTRRSLSRVSRVPYERKSFTVAKKGIIATNLRRIFVLVPSTRKIINLE